jgi:hypothetical protein
MRGIRTFFLLSFLTAVFHAPLSAQTTGSVTGHVTDEAGAGLPGVTVEARGAALPGSQTAITQNDGSYRLSLLPPGNYTVTATLTGFGRAQESVVVSLGRTATVDIRLRPTATEAIVVTGEAPVVDTTSTAVGTNIDSRLIQSIPSGRNYSSIVQIAPGVSTQVSNTKTFANTITVYGSTGLENSFVIDGVNTSGVEYGAQGKELNYEFIQEIDVKTGGYQAEFGRSTGGIITVITKSGGNEFHGDVFGYYDNDSLRPTTPIPTSRCWHQPQLHPEGLRRRPGRLHPEGPPVVLRRLRPRGQHHDQRADGGPQHRAGDRHRQHEGPRIRQADLGDLVQPHVRRELLPGPEGGLGRDQRRRAHLERRALDLPRAAGHRRPRLVGPLQRCLRDVGRERPGRASRGTQLGRPGDRGGQRIQYVDTRKDALQTGGFGLIQNKNFKRYFYGLSWRITWGITSSREASSTRGRRPRCKAQSGGQLVTIFDNPGNAARPVYQHFYWSVPGASLPNNIPISQLNANPKHKSYAAYLQDSWAILPNLTANLGIRWDQQQIFDANGTKQIDLKNDFAPRIGFVWDPTKDHRTRVFGSFGRFYEHIPMDLVIRSYSFEQQPVVYNFDPVSTVPDNAAADIAGDVNKVLGAFTEPSDPNLHGQYVREFLLGAEREVIPGLAVGAKYIYRNYGEVIEDFLCMDDGTYCVGNPGEGIMERIFSLDYTRTFPAPKPVRIYRGVQIDVTRRFSDSWSMLASYLWSKLDGNYDGAFAPFTQPRGTADPNISAAYDYYEFFTNGDPNAKITNNGPLSNDRRSQLKLSGVYVAPFNLTAGLTAYYRTGAPLTRYGFSNAYSRYEFFLTERGGDGRMPADYEVDLHLGYPLALGPVTVRFLVDVFSLLNAQKPLLLDERYNTPSSTTRATPAARPEATTEAVQLVPWKTDFRTAPRQVRFGLRVSF